MQADARSVRTSDLFGVVWRSFFLQSSWSYERMQSMGFAFALLPVLRRLYPDPDERAARISLHMEYFNTQPYLASFVLGAAARCEEERVLGTDACADVAELKKTLMAPLGALGDSLFWGGIKPLAAVIAVAALLAGAWWAPLLFLVLYNAVHVTARSCLVFAGYRSRGDIVALMARYNVAASVRRLKVMALAVAGTIAGGVAAWGPAFRPSGTLPRPLLAAGGIAITLGMTALLRAGLSPAKLMVMLAALCAGLALGGIIAR